jgi:hypothetical protein
MIATSWFRNLPGCLSISFTRLGCILGLHNVAMCMKTASLGSLGLYKPASYGTEDAVGILLATGTHWSAKEYPQKP